MQDNDNSSNGIKNNTDAFVFFEAVESTGENMFGISIVFCTFLKMHALKIQHSASSNFLIQTLIYPFVFIRVIHFR